MTQTNEPLRPIQSPMLAAPGVRHGFFTREGGVSEGLYAGLNVGQGSNDDRDRVAKNRELASRWFGLDPDRLATVHQVHSPDVVVVTADTAPARPQADAMVTATPDLILGVLSADCGPVLFADVENRVIGAAHAGWKGALTGVLENTIDAMLRLGARRDGIRATLGPSISGRNYEVGPEFVDRFTTHDSSYAAFFTPSPKPGHAFFDLQALTVHRLAAAGVTADSLGLCTYADPDRFFSYRRTTHAGEPDYGRLLSAIALQPA